MSPEIKIKFSPTHSNIVRTNLLSRDYIKNSYLIELIVFSILKIIMSKYSYLVSISTTLITYSTVFVYPK